MQPETKKVTAQEFVNHTRLLVHYWDMLPSKTTTERLEGLVSSIFGMINGNTDLPAFTLRPLDEKDNEGEDIGGELRDLWNKE